VPQSARPPGAPAAPIEGGTQYSWLAKLHRRDPARGAALRPLPELTSRIAILAMFTFFLFTSLAAGWLHAGWLTGAGFAVGSVLAAAKTRRSGLLTVAVAPPAVFVVALTCMEAASTSASTTKETVLAIAEGVILTLAGVAPWLFAGVLATLVVTVFRGLPEAIDELRHSLLGQASQPASPRLRPAPRGRSVLGAPGGSPAGGPSRPRVSYRATVKPRPPGGADSHPPEGARSRPPLS
jgi:hypothetical protein